LNKIWDEGKLASSPIYDGTLENGRFIRYNSLYQAKDSRHEQHNRIERESMKSKSSSSHATHEMDTLLSNGEDREVPVLTPRRSRKRSITIFVIVSILNVALLTLLWTQLLTPASNMSSSNSGTMLGDTSSPLIGKTAPDFMLKTLKGNSTTLSLASFKGRRVVLNFWASWCGPCKEEAPFLQKIASQLQAQGIVLLGVNAEDTTNDALQFMHTYGVTYPNVQDTSNGETLVKYGVVGFPETFFINRSGVIAAKWMMPLNEQGLKAELAKIAR